MHTATIALRNACFAGLFAAAAGPAFAIGVGGLDPTFGSGGKTVVTLAGVTSASSPQLRLLPDGRLLVAATASNGCGMVRLTPGGALDGAFGTGGQKGSGSFKVAGYDLPIVSNHLAFPADGKLLLLGSIHQSTVQNFDAALARCEIDGSADTAFGGTGGVATSFGQTFEDFYAAAVQADGKVVAAGRAGEANSSFFALARYTDKGALDAAFGTGGKLTTAPGGGNSAAAFAVAIQPDGKIVAAGHANISSANRFALARYLPSGTLDASFGTNGIVTTPFFTGEAYAAAIAVLPGGKILVAGLAGDSVTDFALARYTAAGVLDTTFGDGGRVTTDFAGFDDGVACLAIQPDGRILAGGYARHTQSGNSGFALARYTADGALDASFGAGGKVETPVGTGGGITSLALQPNGDILAAGESGGATLTVARYLATAVPDPVIPAPVVKITGAKKLTTAKAKLTIRGKATGQVTSVTAKLGRKTVKAKGTASWSLKAALKHGRNVLTVTAHGPGGDSAPVRLTIIRK